MMLNNKSFEVDEYLNLLALGDVHFGSRDCLEVQFKAHIDMIKDLDDCAVILTGDLINCLDKDTQVLTKNGWKNPEIISKQDYVLEFNHKTDSLNYHKPKEILFSIFNGKMKHFKTKKSDVLVTPEHNVLVVDFHDWKFKVKKAKDFKNTNKKTSYLLPVSSFYNGPKKYSDDFIELCGWIITEGWASKEGNSTRYSVCQSEKANPAKAKRIEELLKRIGIKFDKRNNNGMVTWRFSAKTKGLELFNCKTKLIPRELLVYSTQDQLKLLFDVLMLGDGYKNKIFATTSEKLKDDFQELCCKIGKLANYKLYDKGIVNVMGCSCKSKPIFVICISNVKGSKITTINNISEVDYNGLVWCLKTKNGFFVVRRNGKVFITGNCGTRTSVGAGNYDDSYNPQEQYEKIIEILDPIKDKIIGAMQGNHEERIRELSSFDITKLLCREIGCSYLGYSALHKLKVNNVNFEVFSAHGSSSSSTIEGKMRCCKNLQLIADADLYLLSHTHGLAHTVQPYYKINNRMKTVEEQTKHFVLTGHFVNWDGSYGERKGYQLLKSGLPKIKLYGDLSRGKKKIEVRFSDA